MGTATYIDRKTQAKVGDLVHGFAAGNQPLAGHVEEVGEGKVLVIPGVQNATWIRSNRCMVVEAPEEEAPAPTPAAAAAAPVTPPTPTPAAPVVPETPAAAPQAPTPPSVAPVTTGQEPAPQVPQS